MERLVKRKIEELENSPLVEQLQLQMEEKCEQMRTAYLEFEDLRREYQRLEDEYRQYKHEKEQFADNKESVLSEYQITIAEQRAIIEKKQLYVIQLEKKVRDQMYEIRSLLKLEEPISSAIPPLDMLNKEQVHDYYLGNQMPAFDLDLELSRFVDRAEQFTGANHLGSRFLKGSSYTIDLRRLFDQLKEERGGVVFYYSVEEKKILFASNGAKNLLGYSPEKFITNFGTIVKAGQRIFYEALESIETTKRLPLLLISRAGEERKVECEMKLIQKGPFAGNVMGMIIE